MQINTKNLVSMTEANQNFSKVAKLVDENGAAVILKNNAPRYIILEYSQFDEDAYFADADVQTIAKAIIKKNINAFLELAK